MQAVSENGGAKLGLILLVLISDDLKGGGKCGQVSHERSLEVHIVRLIHLVYVVIVIGCFLLAHHRLFLLRHKKRRRQLAIDKGLFQHVSAVISVCLNLRIARHLLGW